MILSSDYSMITVDDVKQYPAAYVAFLSEMYDRGYGAEETLTVWQWFLAGWNARDGVRQ